MDAKKQQQQEEEEEEAGDSQDDVKGKMGKGHHEIKTEEKPEVRWLIDSFFHLSFISLNLLPN